MKAVPVIMEPGLARGASRKEYVAFLRAVAAEFLGTLVFIFFATATVTSGCHTADVASSSGNGADTSLTNVRPGSCFLSSTTALLNIALAFGFSLFVVIFFTAPFSGGHINPAVSFAMFLVGKISFVRGFLYIIFQCAGAAVASIILKGLDPAGYKAAAGASNQLNTASGVNIGRGLGFEIILTFGLVLTVFMATDSSQVPATISLQVLAPLAIGMILSVCHLVAIPIDGCSVNPARSFGPAMVSRTFHNYWIFWVGPLAGGAIAASIYTIAFKARGDATGIGAKPIKAKKPEDSAQSIRDVAAKRADALEVGKPVNLDISR